LLLLHLPPFTHAVLRALISTTLRILMCTRLLKRAITSCCDERSRHVCKLRSQLKPPQQTSTSD
jgi:hypothetical protein